MDAVTVIGGGLAGCEAALQLAKQDIPVCLIEMKKHKKTPAHHLDSLCELVCSNSLKAEKLDSAGGLLKQEMKLLGCQLLPMAESCRVPAGGALAVDREAFSQLVTRRIAKEERITVRDEVAEDIPEGNVIVATGPLTDPVLAEKLKEMAGALYFYDAASPIIEGESIDRSVAFVGSRYEEAGKGDYLNCPMNQQEYDAFYDALVGGETVPLHDFEQVFEGCMPVEVMAKRGRETLAFGPLRPVGFVDPKTNKRPYAVVQLRKEDVNGVRYNLVGFQTNLTFGEQRRIFTQIPGLANASFLRYGVMHRNTYLNSPGFLNDFFQVIGRENLFFAGQITGVEGYVESIASGLWCGINMARKLKGKQLYHLAAETILGGLCRHVANDTSGNFQPMNANFGIIPPLEVRMKKKQERYRALSERSLQLLANSLDQYRA